MGSMHIKYWVETGTAGGISVKEAAKHFTYCKTIELIEGRAQHDYSLKNVSWLTGNSIDILPDIIDELIEKRNAIPKEQDKANYLYAIFFLDSHYSDPKPNASKNKECPLLEELAIISRYQDSAIVIIDDARLFYGHPPAPLNPIEWPRIQDIFQLLNEKFPFNTNTIRDDYIISLPERLNEPIDAEWRSRYHIRYPSHEDSIRQQAKNVWGEIKNYLDVT